MKSIDVDTLDDAHEQRNDFRRANGAPMVSDPVDPNKWQRYSRPSGYAKCLDDEEALTNWRIFKAMEGVARSKALAAAVVACKDDDRDSKKELREKAMDKGTANEAADMGTALHAMTARVEDMTDLFEPGEPYATDLAAYTAALAQYGLVSEYVEVQMINDEYRAAGTADRIFRLTAPLVTPTGEILPVGTLVLGDIKTGAKMDFSLPGYSVQMAIYACGQFYDVVTNERKPTPEINQDWTILVHLPVGKGRCEVSWLSIVTGNFGAWIAHEVKKWRREWKNGTNDQFPIAPPVEVTDVLVDELGAQTVMKSEWAPKMLPYIAERLAQIGANTSARNALVLRWPPGVPTPRTGLAEPGHIVQVLDLLDAVEREFSLPFVGPDPRIELMAGGHAGEMDRSNSFVLADSQ